MSDHTFLIVSAVFPPEPVVSAKLSSDLAEALENTHNVTIIAPTPSRPFGFKFEEQPAKSKFNVHYTDSFICPESKMVGRLRETYSFGNATFNFITENHKNIERIYSNTWPLFAQFLTVKAAKRFNIPVTVHVQDIYPEALSNKIPLLGKLVNFILMPIDKYVFKHANHIIAISEKMKDYLVRTRNVKPSKISVVLNWQNEEEFNRFNDTHQSVTKPSSLFTFMYLGNIGPVAGIDLLIDAFVKAQDINARLIIAGSGALKEQLERQAAMHPNVKIEFWDVPDGKVQEIQHLADVMLLPMKKGAASSSIPSKLPAYMFSKKPVIACVDDDSDTALAIKKGQCGWVLAPEDINVLSEHMIAVSNTNPVQLNEMGEMGYNYAIDNFSKKSNLQKLINIIFN